MLVPDMPRNQKGRWENVCLSIITIICHIKLIGSRERHISLLEKFLFSENSGIIFAFSSMPSAAKTSWTIWSTHFNSRLEGLAISAAILAVFHSEQGCIVIADTDVRGRGMILAKPHFNLHKWHMSKPTPISTGVQLNMAKQELWCHSCSWCQ